jgi:hypothetical protein
VLPVTLIVFGVLFLLNNLDLLRIAAVFKFWPVLLIGAGVAMLYARFHSAKVDEPATNPAEETAEPPREAGRE